MTPQDTPLPLRQQMRQRRRSLSPAAQATATGHLCRRLAQQDFFAHAEKIAFYSAIDGEINPRPLLDQALQAGKCCYLPIVSETRTRLRPPPPLLFAMVTTSTVLQENTWGIAEPLLSAPTNGDLIPPTDLDLVLLPLVAFDTACNRLGMGQGYYDRTFAFKQASPASRPYLAGLAHQCQLLERVPSAPHDVPLDAIITDQHSYFRQG